MTPGVSVCFVIRNGILNGYPFWESLESCLPFADEIVISEGYSDDDTYEIITNFKNQHPDKVKVYRSRWGKSTAGEMIEIKSTEAMQKCTREWIYYLQADEVIHEDNHSFIRDVANGQYGDMNSVSFNFNHFIGSWTPLPLGTAAYATAIRMVRNIKSIKLMGDAWTFIGSCHPSVPLNMVPKPIYHFAWVFPKNMTEKQISHANLYTGMQAYQNQAALAVEVKRTGHDNKAGLPATDYDDYPKGIKRLVGKFEYELPERAKSSSILG